MKVTGQLDDPAALLQGKQAPVRIEKQARWAPEAVWKFWRRKNLLTLPTMQPRIVRLTVKKKKFTTVVENSLQSEHSVLNLFRYYELKTNWRCNLSVRRKDVE
jgi:hypothetical protein